jgi:ribosomal protein S1
MALSRQAIQVGDILDARIMRVLPFGAFVEPVSGFDALIVTKDRLPGAGTVVPVRVAEIDEENRRMRLTLA